MQGRFEEELSIRSLLCDMRRARLRLVSSALRKQKRKNSPLLPPLVEPEEIVVIKLDDAECGAKDVGSSTLLSKELNQRFVSDDCLMCFG